MKYPPLKSLHADSSLSVVKLDIFRKLSTDEILQSLRPGGPSSLKARPDGTLIEGHHRVKVLRERGVDADLLPREVISKDEPNVDVQD
jgi:hypothetical protein